MLLAPTLSLSAGSGAAIARPTFSRDFAGEKTLNNGTGPAITFTRASNATFFDANGTLQTAANDTPRFDHSGGSSLGLLIEEARTNSIRNSQAGGSTNGVVQSGSGVLPTNWGISSVLTGTGLSREVIGSGTVNGLAYVDVKISGTNSSGSAINPGFGFEAGNQIAALSGQTWTSSAYVALVSGSLSGVTAVNVNVVERNSGGTFLTQSTTSILGITSTLTRFSVTRNLTEATTAFVNSAIVGTINNGSTVDLTLRIAAPQLEQGAFATSYIPTTAAAATRSADSAVVTPISSFYNQAEGTILAEYVDFGTNSATFSSIVEFNSNNFDNRYLLGTRETGRAVRFDRTQGANSRILGTTVVAEGVLAKTAAGYATADYAVVVNGGSAETSTDTAAHPSGVVKLLIGRNESSQYQNAHIRKLAYYPRRLSNTLLQQLTT